MRLPNFSRFALLMVALVAASAGFAAQPQNLGDIIVEVGTLPITVNVTGSTTDLSNLANVAFEAHGRYQRAVAGRAQFDLRFTSVASNQVRVDVT